MELTRSGRSLGHLTYCSNIHPGESWAEVHENLRRHVPGIREALCPDGDFGIGLRLSGAATRELAGSGSGDRADVSAASGQGDMGSTEAPGLSRPSEALLALRDFLARERCHVFTLNGFPYGRFHGTRVKEEVYLPDWQDLERLRYTNELADVFAAILPEGRVGSVSTVPGAFKDRVTDGAGVERMARHMIEHVVHLVRLERATGRSIVLALEPEPCCFLETIDESVAFFAEHLHGPRAVALLGERLGTDARTAESLLRKHLTLCLDLCHAAIEFEDSEACFDTLENAGIRIGKLQISAGLQLDDVTPDSAERLRPFVDATYLHQVVERHDDTLTRFVDLPDALASLGAEARSRASATDGEAPSANPDTDEASRPNGGIGGGTREWRVHFHVPVFLDDLGDFSSTQSFIREALARHRRAPLSEHLEVETYTWDVLPPRYRTESVDEAIVRELAWVRDILLAP